MQGAVHAPQSAAAALAAAADAKSLAADAADAAAVVKSPAVCVTKIEAAVPVSQHLHMSASHFPHCSQAAIDSMSIPMSRMQIFCKVSTGGSGRCSGSGAAAARGGGSSSRRCGGLAQAAPCIGRHSDGQSGFVAHKGGKSGTRRTAGCRFASVCGALLLICSMPHSC